MPLCRAVELGMRPAVVAEIIHSFSLKIVLDGADTPHKPCLLYHGTDNNEAGDIADCADITETRIFLDVTSVEGV